ncbi:acyl-CoA dehydrogenase family protein [Priestia endophytica]|uniref:acyl-CoA dehydrogenase family protein n=1 Tax=Priestia endophytica TaxID=135735 RepID=UPI000DCA7EB4|nr:acyl-CoA dehydrogenase family protein [Priestia endophytica]RAS80203.1 acyl-CoA dehydrogenase [Priestia endophytica]
MTATFIKTDFQKKWLQRLNPLVEEFASNGAEIDEKSLFPTEHIEKLKKIGYTSLSLPKEAGGEGLALYDLLLFQEKIASGDASTALAIGWHMGITMDLNDKRNWPENTLHAMFQEIKNKKLLNGAATEPKTGSPTRGGRPETTAVSQQDGFLMNGHKTFTTMAPALDYFLVKAWVEEEGAVGEFIVPKTAKGVSIEETWDMIAMRGTGSHDLLLENVFLEKDKLVRLLKGGNKREASGWLLHIPACYLGVALAARNYAIKFAKTYSPNSIEGTISMLPNVKMGLGEMELELLKGRQFLYAVATKWDECETKDEKDSLLKELSAAKLIATNCAINVVDKAMRIVGAKSLQRTNPLQRYYRDVRAGLHNPPMDDMTIMNLAQSALEE